MVLKEECTCNRKETKLTAKDDGDSIAITSNAGKIILRIDSGGVYIYNYAQTLGLPTDSKGHVIVRTEAGQITLQ